MYNSNGSYNGSTGARSDRQGPSNSQQVSPVASVRSARSGVSVRSHPQSHKSTNTQASGPNQSQNQGQNQGQYTGPNSPRISVRSTGQNSGQNQSQNGNQSQGHNSPRISASSGNNTSQGGPTQGHNNDHSQNSPRTSVRSAGQNSSQQGQNTNQSQGPNSARISASSSHNTAQGGSAPGQNNQLQNQNSPPTSVRSSGQQNGGQYQNQNPSQIQSQNSPRTSPLGLSQFTILARGGPAQNQSFTNTRSSPPNIHPGNPQSQMSGPAQGSQQAPLNQSAGTTPIHAQGQQGGHQRQTSTSRMNPAVPAFQSSYQFAQPLQAIQPTMYSPVFPQIPQLAHQSMMADTQEGQKKLNELVQKIRDADNMDSSQQHRWMEDAREAGRLYFEECTRLKGLYNQACFESQTSQRFLANTTENLRQAYHERDRLGIERDAVQAANNKLVLERKSSIENDWHKVNKKFERDLEEKNADIERQRAQIEQQRGKIEQQRQQIEQQRGRLEQQQTLIEKQNLELDHIDARDVKFMDGAQVLWMGQNPASSIKSRRSTRNFEQNPLTSPSVASSATYNVSGMSGLGSSDTTPFKGPIGQSFNQSSPSGYNQSNKGPIGHSFHPSSSSGYNQSNTGLIGQSFNHSPSSSYSQSNSGPSKEIRRRPNLPTQKPVRGLANVPDSPWEAESSRAFNTEPGDTPIAAPRSNALVLSSEGGEDPSLFYQKELAELYQLIEGWAMAYCTTPKISNDQAIARTNQTLWDFMMGCTYDGQRQDAHTHLTTLLNNARSRPWFVFRMGVQYIVNDIFSVTSYKNFSPQVGAELSTVQVQLDQGGLPNNIRSALIDRRAKAIQSAVDSPQWEDYRIAQLNHHGKELRSILGPMLNDIADRSIAGKDLGVIALKAWNLSEKMNTAQLTFVVNFPNIATDKFSAASMISKNHAINPMNLQINHARLMLAITPVITMRDDRGMTIKAKNLHHATVLTMA